MTYWQEQPEYAFYADVQDIIFGFCPDATKVLQIGTTPFLYGDYFSMKNIDDDRPDALFMEDLKVETVNYDFFSFAKPEKYDIVVCMKTFEFVQDQKRYFDRLKEFSSGIVVMTVPDTASLDAINEITGMVPYSVEYAGQRIILIYSVI